MNSVHLARAIDSWRRVVTATCEAAEWRYASEEYDEQRDLALANLEAGTLVYAERGGPAHARRVRALSEAHLGALTCVAAIEQGDEPEALHRLAGLLARAVDRVAALAVTSDDQPAEATG